MRGESKIKFFVLLMAMIVVITSNGPMTFAAGESDAIPNLPAVEEDQTIHSDASDEELADADAGQTKEDSQAAECEAEPETKEQSKELENENSTAGKAETGSWKEGSS